MIKKAIAITLVICSSLAGSLLLTSCADPDETTIPWSRPTDWEGGVPGMGSN